MRYRDEKFYWSYQRGVHWPDDYLCPDSMTWWIIEKSEGFTDVGLLRISESDRAYLTLIPWLPCYITFISHKNDVIIIVKLLYRATSRRRMFYNIRVCFITYTLSNKNTNAKLLSLNCDQFLYYPWSACRFSLFSEILLRAATHGYSHKHLQDHRLHVRGK